MKGLIYKITSKNSNKLYIGSTTQTLQKRLYEHRHNYIRYLKWNTKYTSSYEILKCNFCKIELLEEIEFTDKRELLDLENYYVNNTKNVVNIVNMTGKYKMKSKQRIYCSYCEKSLLESSMYDHKNSTNHIDHVKYYIWN
jgi:predicted GIY-YIG superfamily endonuclease